MWISGFKDLIYINHCENRTKRQRVFSPPYRVTAIAESGKQVWIGTLNGLYTLSGKGFFPATGSGSLLRTRITALEKTTNALIVATRGNGIALVNNRKVYSITRKQGLASDLCNALHISGDAVWVATNNGISLVRYTFSGEKLRYTIQNFNTSGGLISNEVNDLCTSGNKVWVATNQGISVLDTALAIRFLPPPKTYIREITAGSRSYAPDGSLSFDFSDNTISIRFGAITFRNPSRTQFMYRLMGSDSKFRRTKVNEIHFNGLAPGRYELQIGALSASGKLSKHITRLSFTVLRPWYMSWWVYLALGVLAVFILLIVYRSIRRFEKKRADKKIALNRQIAGIELRALQSQMNPHFIFNALNSIQKFIGRNDEDSAYRYLSKFGMLIRSILENPKSGFHSVEEELLQLGLYLELESLRLEEKLEYRIHVDKDVDKENLLVPVMVVQPYVENAIWHGIMPKEGTGHLEIHWEMIPGAIRVTIEDDGVGRSKSSELKNATQNHRPAGMSITEERLHFLSITENFSSSIAVDDLPAEQSGTRVILTLPVKFEF
ncbi:MAG: histidine kinase [Bacteroidota bacterium]